MCAESTKPTRGGRLLLAGRAPEDVAAFQLGGADRGTTYPAPVAGPTIDIRAWPAGRIRRHAVVVLGPDDDDLSAAEADLHQLHEICPHRVEFGFVDVRARAVGVDAVPIQQFVAVHVADPRDHRLI